MTPIEIAGTIMASAASGLVIGWFTFRTKREEGKTSLDVERLHDRQALTDDQAVIIAALQVRCDKMQSDVERISKDWIEAQRQILQLEGKVADNARVIEGMKDESLKRKQDCEETITRLNDENKELRDRDQINREHASTLQRENLLLATALREYGGSPEDAVKQGRRKDDKKGPES